MINNYKQIRSLLRFSGPEDFYFIEILKRRKDNPRLNIDYKHVKEYYIYSIEEFDAMIDDLLTLCELSKAVAYIFVNRRNSHQALVKAMNVLSSAILNGVKMTGILCRVTSESVHGDPQPKTLIDVNDPITENVVRNLLGSDLLAEVRTPKGTHFIVYTSKMASINENIEFSTLKVEGKVKVYEDGCTVLYFPMACTEQKNETTNGKK